MIDVVMRDFIKSIEIENKIDEFNRLLPIVKEASLPKTPSID